MGKTDLGDTAKGFMMIFLVGIMLSVIGGVLLTLTASDPEGYDEDVDSDGTANTTDLIEESHRRAKNLVGLIAFWLPIIGVLMVAIGLVVLSLDQTPVRLTVLSMLIAVPGILLQEIIPLIVIGTIFGIMVSLDVYSTITSKRFPKYEGNLVIGAIHKRIGITKAWIVYGISYVSVFAAGYLFVDNLHVVLSVFAAIHAVAFVCNWNTEKKIQILHH